MKPVKVKELSEQQNKPTQSNTSGAKKDYAVAIAYGLITSLPLSILICWGISWIVYYFRLSYHWGEFGGFQILMYWFYTFVINAIVVVAIALFSQRFFQRALRATIAIGVGVNIIVFGTLLFINFQHYRGQLSSLRAARNNDKYASASTLEDCGKLTDVDYWRTCMSNKVLTSSDRSTCEKQAQRYVATTPTVIDECTQRFAINTYDIRVCATLPVSDSWYAGEQYCDFMAIQKSWEKNNRKTPLSVVEGCAVVKDPVDQEFCYVASLRQLAKGDAAATLACNKLNPSRLTGYAGSTNNDVENIKNICGITIPMP